MDAREKRGKSRETLTAYGVTKTAEEWCEITGQVPAELQTRIYNKNLTPEEMLTVPMRHRSKDKQLYQAFGRSLTLRDWANKLNKHYSILSYRVHRMKLPIEEALTKDSAPLRIKIRDKK